MRAQMLSSNDALAERVITLPEQKNSAYIPAQLFDHLSQRRRKPSIPEASTMAAFLKGRYGSLPEDPPEPEKEEKKSIQLSSHSLVAPLPDDTNGSSSSVGPKDVISASMQARFEVPNRQSLKKPITEAVTEELGSEHSIIATNGNEEPSIFEKTSSSPTKPPASSLSTMIQKKLSNENPFSAEYAGFVPTLIVLVLDWSG